MDKKLKAKWIKALRSGAYMQGREALFERGKYCCLGVLISCKTAAVENAVYKKGGYSMVEKILGGAAVSQIFQDMNDGSGKFAAQRRSFAEIADYIEANL